MKVQRWLATLALLVGLPVAAAAQADSGRISGSVRDQTSAFVAEATVTIKNDRTGELRTAKTNADGYFLVSPLRPSIYTIKAEKAGFRRPRVSADAARGRSGTGARLRAQAGRRAGSGDRGRHGAGAGHQLGPDRRQRQRARGAGPAGQRPADVAADAAGARIAERRRPAPGRTSAFQRPGRRAERHQVRRHRRVRHHRRGARATSNGENNTPFKLQASLENVQEFRVESSNYPAEFGTGTGGQVSVVTKSGTQQLPRRRSSSTFATTSSTRRTTSTRSATHDGSVIAGPPSRCCSRISSAARSADPSLKDRAFFFGSYEGYRLDAGKNFIEGVPSAAAWARAVPAVAALRPGFLAPERRDPAGRLRRTQTSTSRSSRAPRRSGRTPSAAGSTSR